MKLKSNTKSIYQQFIKIKVKYCNYTTEIHRNCLRVKGGIKPTSRSLVYEFILEYTLNKKPKVRIVSPKLVKNEKGEPIPHMYSQLHLCLYQPKYSEFKGSDYLADTIIPWISLWLYYYEQWHITGKWLGGGEHPVLKDGKSKRRTNKLNI